MSYLKSGISLGRKAVVFSMFMATGMLAIWVIIFLGFAILDPDAVVIKDPTVIEEGGRVRELQETGDAIDSTSASRTSLFLIAGWFSVFTLISFYVARKFRSYSLKVLTTHAGRIEEIESKLSQEAKVLEDRLAEEWRIKSDQRRQRNEMIGYARTRTRIGVLKVVVLGGGGWESRIKQPFLMTADEQNIYLTSRKEADEVAIPIAGLHEIRIAGPGTVQSGGGFSGGGFGAEGFVVGASVAAVLNALTTRTTTETVIYLSFKDKELILLNAELGPEAMRIRLSPVFAAVSDSETAVATDVVGQLEKLLELKKSGALSEEEYAHVKGKLLGK